MSTAAATVAAASAAASAAAAVAIETDTHTCTTDALEESSAKRVRDRAPLQDRDELQECVALSSSSSSAALVSVIMPVHNAALYLHDAFNSVAAQTHRPLELVCFDDCSTDNSFIILEELRELLVNSGVSLVVGQSSEPAARGPGYGRNQAVALSSGTYLCHLDADDLMAPLRVERQYEMALLRGDNCLIGCNFNRTPVDSTPYYTNWLNEMSDEAIVKQQFRECTIICPSWFMHRKVFDNVATKTGHPGGAFVEQFAGVKRVPEDTFFFMDHLEHGGRLSKVHAELVTYRYTENSWCLGTPQSDLNTVRKLYIERRIIMQPGWENFTIWGAGKDGRKFANLLSKEAAKRIVAFCDIDPKKIGTKYYIQSCKRHVPVVHFTGTVYIIDTTTFTTTTTTTTTTTATMFPFIILFSLFLLVKRRTTL
jgi:glycosyltransferase involved in cell wall biosynthesis